MQVVGVGFSQPYWKQFTQELRSYFPSDILVGTLLSKKDLQPHKIIGTCTRLAELAPDLLLLTLRVFSSSEDLFFFLSQVRLRCGNAVQCGLIIENFKEEIGLLLEGDPIVQLSNGMRFSLSHTSLLVEYELRRFPRISVESEIKGVTYENISGQMTWHSLDFFPLHALIPFQQIQQLETQTETLAPDLWLEKFLTHSSHDILPDQVRGILKEEHGCVLFPGIPLSALEQISLGEIELHFILAANQLSRKSIAFKRMLNYLKNRITSKEIAESKQEPIIYCIETLPVVNHILGLILENQGYRNVEFVSGFNGESEGAKLQVQVDWRLQVQEFLKPLSFFVDWKQLEGDLPQSRRLISLVELERQRDEMTQKQKQMELEAQLARNKSLFFDQELWILKKAEEVRKVLTQCLTKTLDWAHVLSHPYKVDASQALLLCEEEEDASELNSCLLSIPKRLWMNPFKYTSPTDLARIDRTLFQKYHEHGVIIIAPKVQQHLMQVCEETEARFSQVSVMLEQQQKIMEQTTKELEELQSQKEEFALYWLYISLKQLVIANKALLSPDTSSTS